MKRKMEADPMQRKIKALEKDLFRFQLRPTLWYLGVCLVLYVSVSILLGGLVPKYLNPSSEGVMYYLREIYLSLSFSSLPILWIFLFAIGFTSIVMRMNPCLQQGVTRSDFMGRLMKSSIFIILIIIGFGQLIGVIFMFIHYLESSQPLFFFWFDYGPVEQYIEQYEEKYVATGEAFLIMHDTVFNRLLDTISGFCRCLICLLSGCLVGLSFIAFRGKRRIATVIAGTLVLLTQFPSSGGDNPFARITVNLTNTGFESGPYLFLNHLNDPIQEMGTIIQRAVVEHRNIFSEQFPRPALDKEYMIVEDNMYIDINHILAVLLTLILAIGLPLLLKRAMKRIEIRVR